MLHGTRRARPGLEPEVTRKAGCSKITSCRIDLVSRVVSKLKRPLFVASEMSGFG